MACFQVHLSQKGQKVKVPTEAFVRLSPDAVMLFAPYGYTHQPPPFPSSSVPPFCSCRTHFQRTLLEWT